MITVIGLINRGITISFKDKTIWFKCIGCGNPAVYFKEDLMYNPKGSVGHTRSNSNNLNNSLKCKLYLESTAEEFWKLNQNSERIDPPTGFKPINN